MLHNYFLRFYLKQMVKMERMSMIKNVGATHKSPLPMGAWIIPNPWPGPQAYGFLMLLRRLKGSEDRALNVNAKRGLNRGLLQA